MEKSRVPIDLLKILAGPVTVIVFVSNGLFSASNNVMMNLITNLGALAVLYVGVLLALFIIVYVSTAAWTKYSSLTKKAKIITWTTFAIVSLLLVTFGF